MVANEAASVGLFGCVHLIINEFLILGLENCSKAGTRLPIAVESRHRRNTQFLSDHPPGQTFLISKPDHFVPAK